VDLGGSPGSVDAQEHLVYYRSGRSQIVNERIRELAHWVGLSSHDSIKLQQFAELIVEECAELCDINDEEQGDILREHFGVKS
jgi:hypothetical protein